MGEKTAWEQSSAAEGTTDSERALTKLAKKAFLSLWSYSNVFTDEGRSNGKGNGKELCDLLVVFGNDVLLFSDKDCEYHSGTDVKGAWPRWYKRAIEKSVNQLAGAEKFVKAFPTRIFIDKQCRVLEVSRSLRGAASFRQAGRMQGERAPEVCVHFKPSELRQSSVGHGHGK
jgi:hypothetical protein